MLLFLVFCSMYKLAHVSLYPVCTWYKLRQAKLSNDGVKIPDVGLRIPELPEPASCRRLDVQERLFTAQPQFSESESVGRLTGKVYESEGTPAASAASRSLSLSNCGSPSGRAVPLSKSKYSNIHLIANNCRLIN